MVFRNRTRGVPLAEKAEEASTPLARMRGLMWRPSLGAGEGLFLEPCSSIHTCFMRFPIDAVFVDRQNRIVKLVERMAPWRITWISLKARAVLELPAGTVASTGTRVGDQLEKAASA